MKYLVYASIISADNDKYTEDQVVALVRKCYNENLKPMFNGNYRINESYFYDARTRRRMRRGLNG